MKKSKQTRSFNPNPALGGFAAKCTFRDRVQEIVMSIPRGKVLTYKEVATMAGSPNASRAVGSILKKNYNPKIPCHRVIRSDGLTGDYNRGRNTKIALLKSEGAI